MKYKSAPPSSGEDDITESIDSSFLVPPQEIKTVVTTTTTTTTVTIAPTQLIDEAQTEEQDDYQRNVSNTSTLSSIICVVAGTGILAIAHALSRSGWIGLFFLILGACMSQFTGIILIQCLYTTNGRLKDYADIGLASFGKPGQIIGGLFQQLFLFLTPTIYMIMASENISAILTGYGFIWLDRKACIWIISVVVGVPFLLVRNMKDVSFLSTFASMATVCLLLIVCVVSMSDFNTSQVHNVHHDVAIPRNIPIALSTFSFSYCGHVIYPQLEASMQQPKRWFKVLLVATCVISIMYFTMGFICYLVFGDTVQSPVYKSLPVGSSQNIAMFVITLHVLLVIPFYLYVFTSRFETKFKQTSEKHKLIKIALRIAQVLLCGILAMFIPYFSDFMTLVGAILSDTLTFVLPSLFWIKLNYARLHSKLDYLIFVTCALVATIGICCATFGTIDAVKAFILDYQK